MPEGDRLNAECFCIGLDEAALHAALDAELGPELTALVRERCPHLFSARPVFVAERHLRRIEALVRAVESVAALPGWRAAALADAPAIARHDPGTRSVFFGYDVHLAGDQLGLIEINTNAGGAMLNAALARAQRACCPPVEALLPKAADADALERRIALMFSAEWRLARRAAPLRRIAIVDDDPSAQYLYAEFLLFARLFERHAWQAVVADPAELQWRDGALWHASGAVDLVYNRLTDFYLESPAHAALRQAYLAGAVVLTPHPRAHALFADKRNLAHLSDATWLAAIGVPPETREILQEHVPRTEVVDAAHAARLWSERKGLFFKPRAGFGSRAAYRGDKLTRRVWDEILAGDYVAQALLAPGQRVVDGAADAQPMKFDLRAYVYDGAVQWVAARLYQGQTTNFRTPGGGFAPALAIAHGA